MKKLYTTLAIALLAISVFAQTPNISMTTTTAIGSAFSFTIAATADNTTIQVDWGNGSLIDCPIASSSSVVSGTLAGETIKIYGIGISYLNVESRNITSLDVTKNTALNVLWCYGNKLTTLDVTKNAALTYLHCNNNKLTNLDVTNNTELIYLYCSSNKLTTLDVTKNTAIIILNCYDNSLSFSTLPIKQNSWQTYTYSHSFL